MDQPRGVQEQVSAITGMLTGGDDEIRDEEVDESPAVEPDQDAQGESLE